MKVTGVIVALAASAPMAAAIPFSLSSFLAPLTARGKFLIYALPRGFFSKHSKQILAFDV